MDAALANPTANPPATGCPFNCSVYTDPTDLENCCQQYPDGTGCNSGGSSSSSGGSGGSSSSSSSGGNCGGSSSGCGGSSSGSSSSSSSSGGWDSSSSSSSSSSSGGGCSGSSSGCGGGSSSSSSSSSSGGSCSSSSSSSSSGGNEGSGNCCGGCGQCGHTLKCGVLGYFTGCPASGVLVSGGTPLEIAKLLESYAGLINAFNASDGGKAIIAEVAKQIGSMNPGLFIQQSVELSKAPGSQLALLATLGNSEDSAVINAIVSDAMGAGKISGKMKKVVDALQVRYNNATGAEKATALMHLNNALNIVKASETTLSTAIVAPFKDAQGRLIKNGKAITAEDITHSIVKLALENQEYQPAQKSNEATTY